MASKTNFEEVWERIKDNTNLHSFRDLAKFLEIEPASITGHKRKGVFNLKHAQKIAEKYKFNIDWLLTGKGTMMRWVLPKAPGPAQTESDQAEHEQKHNTTILKNMEPGEHNDDLNSLLTMTKEVLQSNTVYSASLAANIKSFHRAVYMESKISDPDKIKEHEERLTAIESQLQERKKMTKKLDGHGKKTDAYGPEGRKSS